MASRAILIAQGDAVVQNQGFSSCRSSWENGYCESFNSKLRDEFLNGEIFYSIRELRVLAERWSINYNVVRPHSSLGYRPSDQKGVFRY